MYKLFLSSDFESVPEQDADLIKVVEEDGRVRFYHPVDSDVNTENTQKAVRVNADLIVYKESDDIKASNES